MPKSKDKTKGAKKRRKSLCSDKVNTAESDGCNPKPAKKKKLQKQNGIEGVDKSRKLKERLKKPRASRSSTSVRNKDPKLCGNGKPMPPLSVLEKMYEDSDGNDDPPEIKPSSAPDRPVTPETKPDSMIKDENTKLLSPKTLKNIATKVLDMISNSTEDNCPPSSIIPPKKPNKSGIPFIVGCKERAQVPWAPKTSFCKGSPKYGVEPNNEEECKGENVGPHYANVSKSLFNAQSEVIAERLKELERLESLGITMAPTTQTTARSGSPDSNKTVPYDFPDSPKSGPRSFSPLPSTSKDRETILKNDELFNQSLKCESIHSNSSQEDVEIVEVPCETIIIDDTVPDLPKPVPMDVDIDPVDLDDDCCVIIESESSMKPKQNSFSPIEIKDDIYGSLDLTQSYDDNEVCEIIDVDDVIAENRALLDKYRRENDLDSVILVTPNTTAIKQNTSNQELSNTNPSNASRDPRESYSNGPVLATVENASSRPSVMNFTPPVENRNDIRDVVTSFFRERPNHTGGEHAPVEVISKDDLPNPVNDNESNNAMGRILSWLSSMSGMIANSKAKRKRNRELVQSNRRSSEIIVEPRPRTSAEVTDILTQALANANQQHTQHHNQDQQQQKLQQHLLQEQSIDKSSKGLGDCPICMDNLSNNAIASTLCGHIFCMSCIKTAIRANGKRCPTCRKALKGVGYHQLFL